MTILSPRPLLALAACAIVLTGMVSVGVAHATADPDAAALEPTASVVAAVASATASPAESEMTPLASPSQAFSPTPTASPSATKKPKTVYRDTVANAKAYVKRVIGATQYNCIDQIFYHESRWNPRAMHPSSGNPSTASYGIPQAHPGSKMAKFGSNWRTSPLTQVKWGIWYVNSRYGSACAAYRFKANNGWY